MLLIMMTVCALAMSQFVQGWCLGRPGAAGTSFSSVAKGMDRTSEAACTWISLQIRSHKVTFLKIQRVTKVCAVIKGFWA